MSEPKLIAHDAEGRITSVSYGVYYATVVPGASEISVVSGLSAKEIFDLYYVGGGTLLYRQPLSPVPDARGVGSSLLLTNIPEGASVVIAPHPLCACSGDPAGLIVELEADGTDIEVVFEYPAMLSVVVEAFPALPVTLAASVG